MEALAFLGTTKLSTGSARPSFETLNGLDLLVFETVPL